MIALCQLLSCRISGPGQFYFESPQAGDIHKQGDAIKVTVVVPPADQGAQVRFFVDDEPVSTNQNGPSITLPTTDWKLGIRKIKALVDSEKPYDIVTNIVLKARHKPVNINYKVVAKFPHDTSAYTQGLSYVDGKLLESTGQKGKSAVKWVDLTTGKTVRETPLGPDYFGEGSVKVDEKIIVLTWQENIGLVFDAKSLRQIGTFPYENSKEGWGLTFDGKQLLKSDGTNRIWRINKNTYKEEGYIEVYDHNGPINDLNELEYINGKIYANVYPGYKIVVIDPLHGRVEATIDLNKLVSENSFLSDYDKLNNVLNGIAWDEIGKRLFVGGKKWAWIYQIELIQ